MFLIMSLYSVRMQPFFLDMISEDDVVWMDKIHKRDY